MSGKIVGEVMRYAPDDLTVAQRFVLVALAESAHDHGTQPRTSRTNSKEIAANTGLKEGTVRNALSELVRRCLIQPLHNHSKIGHNKLTQQYRLAQLHAHHRAATASLPSDTEALAQRHSPVTPKAVDNPDADDSQRHSGTATASLPSDTIRKELPVTTVGSNSSRQVTVEPRTENELPPSLRSVAIDDPAPATPPVSRGSPPTTRQPDRRASRRRRKG